MKVQSECNVVNIGEPDMTIKGKARLASVHFTEASLFDDIFIAAGAPPEELQDWWLYSGRPDIDLSSNPQTIIVKPEIIRARTEGCFVGGLSFSEAATIEISSLIFERVALHERNKADAERGILANAWATLSSSYYGAVGSARRREALTNSPHLFSELKKITLPNYVAVNKAASSVPANNTAKQVAVQLAINEA